MGRIRAVLVEKGPGGGLKRVQVLFGPHYVLDITDEAGRVRFVLGPPNDGSESDAAAVGAELDPVSAELRREHPQNDVG